MKTRYFKGPGYCFDQPDVDLHHWYIDVSSAEYVELATWLKGLMFHGRVEYYPQYVPGIVLTGTQLQMSIIAENDRDATLLKLSL